MLSFDFFNQLLILLQISLSGAGGLIMAEMETRMGCIMMKRNF